MTIKEAAEACKQGKVISRPRSPYLLKKRPGEISLREMLYGELGWGRTFRPTIDDLLRTDYEVVE